MDGLNRVYILDKFRNYLKENKLYPVNLEASENGLEGIVSGKLNPDKFTQTTSDNNSLHWVRLSIQDLYNELIVGNFRF